MALYLCKWVAYEENPGDWCITPDTPNRSEDSFGAFDLRSQRERLRPDPVASAAGGWCLVNSRNETWTEAPGRRVKVGDTPQARSKAARTALRRATGYQAFGDRSIGEAVFDFYNQEGDDNDLDKPNRLKPNYRRHGGDTLITVGGLVLHRELPKRSLGAAFADDFDSYTAGDDLHDQTDWTRSCSYIHNVSFLKYIESVTAGGATYTFWDDELDTDEMFSEVTIRTIGSSAQLGACTRALNSNANSSCYLAYVDQTGARRIRYTNTTVGNPGRVNITTQTGDTNSVGGVVRCECDDADEIRFYYDAVEDTDLTTTDTTYAASSLRRRVGIYTYASPTPTNVRIDNFNSGDLAIDATATPGVIEGTGSMPSPTLAVVESASASPGVINGVGSMPSPSLTVSEDGQVSPTPITGTGEMPSPTITATALVLPAVIEGVGTMVNPSGVGNIQEVNPLVIEGTGSMPAPAVISVDTTVTPGVIEGVGEMPIPQVGTLADSFVIEGVGEMPAATVATSSAVAAAVIEGTGEMPTPSVQVTFPPTNPVNPVDVSPWAKRGRKRYIRNK